jgi:hypothetical protein
LDDIFFFFSASNFQRRWKSLRDSYTRELAKKKKEKSGSGASGRRQYVFFEQLRFLETSVKSTLNSIVDENEDRCQNDPSPVEEAEEHAVPTRKRKKNIKEPTETDHLIENLKAKFYSRETSNENKDEDTLFMLSLVPELKKLPELVKLDTKSEILNVLRRARNQSIPVTSNATNFTPYFSPQHWQPHPHHIQHHVQQGNFQYHPQANVATPSSVQTGIHSQNENLYELASPNVSVSSNMSSEIEFD